MNREPLLTTAGVTAVVAAILAVLFAFGLDLTADQTAAILGLVGVIAPLVVALVARGKVTPTADPRTDEGVPLVPVGSAPPPAPEKEMP